MITLGWIYESVLLVLLTVIVRAGWRMRPHD